jgi:hypothetical protein
MRTLRIAFLLFGCACLLPIAARGADSDSDAAANAAVQYWQAIAVMPALDEQQEKIIQEWNTVPLDDAAVQLINSSQSSMLYLRRGSKLQHCDWGLDHRDGISMLMPHLAKCRDLARLGRLHVRYKFERGDKQGAREDATAIMALGRHVGQTPVMISTLVRYLIEGAAVDAVAPYVPEIKAPHAQAVRMYESLPPSATLSQAILQEKTTMVSSIVQQLRDAERKKPGSWRELWKELLASPDIPPELQKIASLDECLRQLDALLPVYDEMARLVELSKPEFDAKYPAFRQKTNEAHPLAGTVLPAINKILSQQRKHEARVAMLLAAIAVAEGGPDKLKEFKDPFGSGPFEYRALDKGFELKSQLLFEDKPVTLVVGQGPATQP